MLFVLFFLSHISSTTPIISGVCLCTREERYHVAYTLLSRDGEVLHSTLGDIRETSDKYLPVLPMNGGSWIGFSELLSSC